MPESRATAGINQELVGFTVMPFDFVPVSPRDIVQTPSEQVLIDQSIADTFRRFQMVALIALGGVFIGTAISSVVSHIKNKKHAKAEAEGYYVR